MPCCFVYIGPANIVVELSTLTCNCCLFESIQKLPGFMSDGIAADTIGLGFPTKVLPLYTFNWFVVVSNHNWPTIGCCGAAVFAKFSSICIKFSFKNSPYGLDFLPNNVISDAIVSITPSNTVVSIVPSVLFIA